MPPKTIKRNIRDDFTKWFFRQAEVWKFKDHMGYLLYLLN